MARKIRLECIEGIAPCLPPGCQEEFKPDSKLTREEMGDLLGLNEKPRFIEIQKTAIFKEGIWNGNEYNRADILQMVTNYHRMKKTWIPTLKVSHAQGEFLTNTEWSEGAHGQVTDMWEEDGTIYASFEFNIDFYTYYIADKSLNHKSVEIWSSIDYNGTVYENVISNVALLGVSMPACGDLGEIENEDSTYRVYEAKSPKSESLVFEFIADIDERKPEMSEKTENAIVEPESKALDVEETSKDTENEDSIESSIENSEEEEQEETEGNSEEEEQEEEQEETEENSEEADETQNPLEVPAKEEMKLSEAKIDFELRLKAIEEKLTNQFKDEIKAKEFVIESFKKERTELKIKNDVEDLIREGHVVPANREICKTIFNSLDKVSKVNFEISPDEVIEDATTLLKRFLKSYSAWQSDSETKSDDIESDFTEALPSEKEDHTIIYNGSSYKADGVQDNKEAWDLKAKYEVEGKTKTFIECYTEIINKRENK